MKEHTKRSIVSEKNNQALQFVILLLIIGILFIIIYAFRSLWWVDNTPKTVTANGITTTTPHIVCEAVYYQLVISSLSVGIFIAGSALALGCIGGFIFAIPKPIATSDNNLIKTQKGYISNDNFVQVSDWLTKIIVGVGLTKLTQIPGYMQHLGVYLGEALGGTRIGEVAVESIVIYFLICGFLLSYLWTRLYFGRMLEDAEETTTRVTISATEIKNSSDSGLQND